MTSKKNLKDAFIDGEDKGAFEHSLINLVEPRRFLWDTKDKDYKNKLKRQNAFTTIATTLGKSNEVCIGVWESVRSQYLACRRKLPTGSGADAVPSFRHYMSMLFLSGAQYESQTFCNVGDDADGDAGSSSSLQDDVPLTITLESSSKSDSEVVTDVKTKSSEGVQGKSTPHTKFTGKRKSDPVDEELLKCLKSMNDGKSSYEFEAFGNAVACKLRRLHELDRKEAAVCQLELHKVIHEFELKLL